VSLKPQPKLFAVQTGCTVQVRLIADEVSGCSVFVGRTGRGKKKKSPFPGRALPWPDGVRVISEWIFDRAVARLGMGRSAAVGALVVSTVAPARCSCAGPGVGVFFPRCISLVPGPVLSSLGGMG
jgi:hypothetical protein